MYWKIQSLKKKQSNFLYVKKLKLFKRKQKSNRTSSSPKSFESKTVIDPQSRPCRRRRIEIKKQLS